jgi:cation transport ATPase
MALRRLAREERKDLPRRQRAASSRLGWMALSLGLIALDLEALAFLAALYPLLDPVAQALVQYNPAVVTTVAMLALGWPPALAGLVCAGMRRPAGIAGMPAVAALAACALGLAIPVSYAAFALMYLRGLI